VVLDRSEDAVWKSFRNLGERVQIIMTDELNTYDVLVNDSIVFSQSTLTALVGRFGPVNVTVEIDIDGDDTDAGTADEADGGAQ
jgi:large subunit ribosomal protein L4